MQNLRKIRDDYGALIFLVALFFGACLKHQATKTYREMQKAAPIYSAKTKSPSTAKPRIESTILVDELPEEEKSFESRKLGPLLD